jgi:galactose mutarotase-like enzyme
MEYVIENDFLRVTVAGLGAQLMSVEDKATGAQMLWDGKPEVWPRRAPLLFPYCGRLRDGAFTHKGTRYEGGQHGFARDMEFAPVEMAADHVTLRLEANALTMEKFPFAFQLTVTFALQANTLVHRVEVLNDSDEIMPFGLGYHPGFMCPFDEQHTVQDYVVRFDTPQSPVVIETGAQDGLVTGRTRTLFTNECDLPLSDHLFDHDSICLSQLTCRTVSLVEKDTGRSITVNTEAFPYVLLWSTAGPLQFLCIEPWHSLPDRADANGLWTEKPAAARLEPGESWATQLEMTFAR